MRNQIFFAGALLLAGCGQPTQSQQVSAVDQALKAIENFKPNLSSPDFAVKSWWEAKDLQRNLAGSYCYEQKLVDSDKIAAKKLQEIASVELFMSKECNPDVTKFERDITGVDIQSETRAVVSALIKNSSAPESGAIVTTAVAARKETGTPFRYILNRKEKSEGWKVESVEVMKPWKNSWEKVYTKPEPNDNSYVYDKYQ